MKRILVVLAVMILPQTVGLSTLCNAGSGIGCPSNADGSCTFAHLICGAISQGKTCQTIPNPAFVGAAAKRVQPPQEQPAQYLCECMK